LAEQTTGGKVICGLGFEELTQWGGDFGLLGRGAGRDARGCGKRLFP